MKVMKNIANLDFEFSAVILKKETVYSNLHNNKQILHNYLTGYVAEILPYSGAMILDITIDKFISKKNDQEKFNEYLRDTICTECKRVSLIPPREIKIAHKSSESCAGLQVVDFIAGALFSKYERNEGKFYGIIKHKEGRLKERF